MSPIPNKNPPSLGDYRGLDDELLHYRKTALLLNGTPGDDSANVGTAWKLHNLTFYFDYAQ